MWWLFAPDFPPQATFPVVELRWDDPAWKLTPVQLTSRRWSRRTRRAYFHPPTAADRLLHYEVNLMRGLFVWNEQDSRCRFRRLRRAAVRPGGKANGSRCGRTCGGGLAQFLAQRPDLPPPDEVRLLIRIYPTPAAGDSPRSAAACRSTGRSPAGAARKMARRMCCRSKPSNHPAAATSPCRPAGTAAGESRLLTPMNETADRWNEAVAAGIPRRIAVVDRADPCRATGRGANRHGGRAAASTFCGSTCPRPADFYGGGSLGSPEVFAGRLSHSFRWSLLAGVDGSIDCADGAERLDRRRRLPALGIFPRRRRRRGLGTARFRSRTPIRTCTIRATMVRQILLFYLLLSPCGAAWSVASWWNAAPARDSIGRRSFIPGRSGCCSCR